jgi:uncharacterized protein (TIGR02284 family)
VLNTIKVYQFYAIILDIGAYFRYTKNADVKQYASIKNLLKFKCKEDIMKYSEEISNKLNELLIKNYDAEKGYLNAMDNVESSTLKIFFKRRASERSEFAKELRTEILRYGEIPEDSGSFKGVMYRNWMNLKTLFTSNDEEAILEEAIRGEEKNLEEYRDILKDRTMPPSIESILIKQKNAIQAAINTEKVHEELVS